MTTVDVTCLGEALIDFVPLERGVSFADASRFLRAPGGAPANVAAGVARLGGASAFIGRVGDDPFGRFIRDTLARDGVDTRGMRFDTTARTGLAFVALGEGGERDFCFFRNPSADMLLSPGDVDAGLVAGSRAFHFGSISLIDSPAREATEHALGVARRAGAMVSYDPNLRPALWPDLESARRTIRCFLSLVDVVKVSDEELRFLTGQADVAEGLRSLAEGCPGLLVATRGARGCAWRLASGATGALRGHAVRSVDTTGAGDAFVAAMVLSLVRATRGGPLSALDEDVVAGAMRRANAAGALATTVEGAIPSLPSAAAVEALAGAEPSAQ